MPFDKSLFTRSEIAFFIAVGILTSFLGDESLLKESSSDTDGADLSAFAVHPPNDLFDSSAAGLGQTDSLAAGLGQTNSLAAGLSQPSPLAGLGDFSKFNECEPVPDRDHFLTTESRTRAAQQALTDISIETGPADGEFGPVTCRAIVRWKIQQKMEVNGFIENEIQFCKLLREADEASASRVQVCMLNSESSDAEISNFDSPATE